MNALVVLLILAGLGLVAWRVLVSYGVASWVDLHLRADRARPQLLSPTQLVRRVSVTALEAKSIGIDGLVALPNRIAVAVSPLDVTRVRDGLQGLAREATSALVRHSRKNSWRVPSAIEIVVVPDGHTLEGRPQLLPCEPPAATDRTPQMSVPNGDSGGSRTVTERPLSERSVIDVGPESGRTTPYVATELIRLPDAESGHEPVVIDLSERRRPLTIGREGSDVCLAPKVVSRRHATLTLVSGRWVLTDAGSLNGIFVNGTRVSEAALLHNDEVQLGTSGPRFVFSRLSTDLPTQSATGWTR